MVDAVILFSVGFFFSRYLRRSDAYGTPNGKENDDQDS